MNQKKKIVKNCNKCKTSKNINYYKIENYSKNKYCDICIDCSNEVKECEKCKIIKKLYEFKVINKYKKNMIFFVMNVLK